MLSILGCILSLARWFNTQSFWLDRYIGQRTGQLRCSLFPCIHFSCFAIRPLTHAGEGSRKKWHFNTKKKMHRGEMNWATVPTPLRASPLHRYRRASCNSGLSVAPAAGQRVRAPRHHPLSHASHAGLLKIF